MVTLRLSELQTLRRRLGRNAARPDTKHAILDKHLDVQGSDPLHSGAWGSSPIEDYFEDRLVRDQKLKKP
jgi:hypothetical protein